MLVLLDEGKTKIIKPCPGNPHHILIESKDDVTAGDGSKKDILPNKGYWSALTAANCFRLLEDNDIQTHFCNYDPWGSYNNVLEAKKCVMIPLKVVVRRFAEGSFCRRYPFIKKGKMSIEPIVELFLKDDELHNPYLEFDETIGMWKYFPASESLETARPCFLRIDEIFKHSLFHFNRGSIDYVAKTAEKVFMILEKAWAKQEYTLVDLRVEFGFSKKTKEILLADVIDNDSWRLRKFGVEKGKPLYRDGESLSKVLDAYIEVALASTHFS